MSTPTQAGITAPSVGTTEPTVHRIVTRLQDRLLVDSYLLHVLCGLKVEGKDFIAAHAPLLAWLQDDQSMSVFRVFGTVERLI